MCVPTRFLSHSISQLKSEFCTRNKIKWLALMICCIKASHHKAPATFASIHFCFQSSASSFCIQLSAANLLHPAFYIQPLTSSPLHPTASAASYFIHNMRSPSEICHNPIQDHEPDNTREDILEVESKAGRHLKTGAGIDFLHIVFKSPAVLPRTEERDNHGADRQH